MKSEQLELREVDALAKRLGCAVLIVHHASKAGASLDGTLAAAGSFMVAGATEALVYIQRFQALDGGAPERLVQIQGRHADNLELVVRFRKAHLDYEHVLEGSAAPHWPVIIRIHNEFGQNQFTPKELVDKLGLHRPTAFRMIGTLCRADVLRKIGHGHYQLTRKYY